MVRVDGEKGKDSTGGVLRKIGEFGYLLCKDFTSILKYEPRILDGNAGSTAGKYLTGNGRAMSAWMVGGTLGLGR